MQLAENINRPDFADSRLHVTFYYHPVQDEDATKKEGRPIYNEVEFIKIMVPGDATNIIEQPVDEIHKRRFRKLYEEWKRTGDGEKLQGTPLSVWPQVTRGQVEELAFFGVKTVEHLAGMSDGVIQKFMGGMALRQKAIDFLEAAKGTSHITSLRAELDAAKNEREAMAQQMKDMAEQMAELRKAKGR
jgi:hypothetical protein